MDYKALLQDFIETISREEASDLHLVEGRHPVVRVTGALSQLLKKPILTREMMLGFLDLMLTPENKALFLANKEMNFSYSHNDTLRFRGNAFVQQGFIGVALRIIPRKIRTVQELHLPPILATFAEKRQGFFLVVGPVGQGKTTTLAALIDLINSTRTEHIITIEDPIEYIFEQNKSIIEQREVRIDTKDFGTGLDEVFRQDVNVVMIGEMRDRETISTAVTAAETGHLVLSTLHTNNAAQTIERIVDSFPSDQQNQIRIQLAGSLTGIFSQRLIPKISGGLVPAHELLVVNNAVSNLIREKRTHELNSIIETGSDQGMIDMNRCLADLVRTGEITPENAYLHSFNPQGLEKMI